MITNGGGFVNVGNSWVVLVDRDIYAGPSIGVSRLPLSVSVGVRPISESCVGESIIVFMLTSRTGKRCVLRILRAKGFEECYLF